MLNNISIEGARILFRNFSGKEGQFNAAGDRNFCVVIPDSDMAERMKEDGWNVRYLTPLEPDDPSVPYIQVKLSYKNRPPKVVLITSRGQTSLDESTVDMLDYADISNVDIIINPYQWTMAGRSGVKGYVKAIYVTIEEDEFEKKYAAQETSAMDSLRS